MNCEPQREKCFSRFAVFVFMYACIESDTFREFVRQLYNSGLFESEEGLSAIYDLAWRIK